MTIKFLFIFLLAMVSPLLYGQSKITNESIIYSNDTSPYKKEITSSTFLKLKHFYLFLNQH